MAIKDVETKCYILALFIRNDGARFLLGSGAYEFKEGQQHFAANTMANDVVEVQGNDGYLLAGQVRRPGVQSFDGYVGDSSTGKPIVEGLRRDFFQFFRKGYFYKVVYVFPDGSAIQRKRGFLVDAPVVQELYQIYPEYHVALNFEDINYYFYDENDEGEEIYGKSAIVGLSMATGGLLWDEDGAVTDPLVFSGVVTVKGVDTINNLLSLPVPLASVGLYGDTFQKTYSGKNLLPSSGYGVTTTNHGITFTNNGDGSITLNGANNNSGNSAFYLYNSNPSTVSYPAGTYYVATPSNTNIGYVFYSGSRYYDLDSSNNYSVTFTSDTPMRQFYAQVRNGNTTNFNNVKIWPMLTTLPNQTEADYEPYVGGIPSPNPDYPQEVQTAAGKQTVAVMGKNLFDKNNVNQFMGYYDGTADSPSLVSGVAGRNRVIYIKCKPSIVYSISFTTLDGVNSPQVGTTDSLPVAGLAVTKLGNFESGSLKLENLTTSATAQYIVVRFQTQNSTVVFDDISQALLAGLQIEQGSTATTYEPYQGQSYTVDLRGTNLLDLNSFVIGGMSSGAPSPTTKYRINNADKPIKVEPDTAYTISAQLVSPVQGFRVGIHECQADGTFIQDLGWKQLATASTTFTTGSTTGLVKIVGSLSTTSTTVNTGSTEDTTACDTVDEFMRGCTLMLEEGSSASAYQPYNPIELCKIGDYQDYIYKSGDDWYVHKETGSLKLDSSLSWSYTSGEHPRFYVNVAQIALEGSFTSEAPILTKSNYFRGSNWYAIYETRAEDNLISSHDSQHRLCIRATRFSSVSDFGNWLDNTGDVIAYYAIATTTDTKITDTNLIAQFNALGSAKLFVGENNLLVTATGTNLPAELEVGCYTEIEDGYGFVWEEGRSPSNIIAVDSIDDVFPVLTITGETQNPILTNVTTGTIFQYNGTITASQTLVVDMMNQTATLNGTSVIGNVTGDWVYFAPGNNRVSYTATNANAPDATIEWQEIVG